MQKEIVIQAQEYVKKMFENDYSGHDYFHTYRVYEMASRIAMQENADLEIVQLAALLHDVDDIKLSPDTYKNKDNARAFLIKNHVDETTIHIICKIIGEISFAGNDSVIPQTLEGKCVQDADRLDAIGAIGIARAFAYSTTVNHFYEKLFLLKDMMNTSTAKEIAESREKYMKDYISEFMDEWVGAR